MTKDWSSTKYSVALLFVATAILLAGCSIKPSKDYMYQSLNPITGWEQGKILNFSLDLTDTINKTEIYFALQIRNNEPLNKIDKFPIEVCLTSPSAKSYYHNVAIPINVIQKKHLYRATHGTIEVELPYIKNILNKEGGVWKISIRQTHSPDIYKNILGFGVSYKRAEQ